jgi:hypothetical protein
MAKVFNEAGISALAVSGHSTISERDQALRDLKDRRVNALFAADLFNEGLDLPEVDTVLFLRPTESPTVFLQQLARIFRGSAVNGGRWLGGRRCGLILAAGVDIGPSVVSGGRGSTGPGSFGSEGRVGLWVSRVR